MLNDVTFPPLDDSDEVPPSPATTKGRAIPGPDKTVADVQLFDHPDMLPSGAGNFWSLGIVGLLLLGLVLMVGWVLVEL